VFVTLKIRKLKTKIEFRFRKITRLEFIDLCKFKKDFFSNFSFMDLNLNLGFEQELIILRKFKENFKRPGSNFMLLFQVWQKEK